MENEIKYNFRKLWHLLVDKEMTKQAGISVSSLARLKKGYMLSYDRMKRICDVVEVNHIEDIIE